MTATGLVKQLVSALQSRMSTHSRFFFFFARSPLFAGGSSAQRNHDVLTHLPAVQTFSAQLDPSSRPVLAADPLCAN